MTSLHRVLVVEDHAPFRSLICKLLRQRPDLEIVGEAVDGWDAIRQAEALRPDVVVLDIGLPGLSGLDAAGRIRGVLPCAKLMFVTIESSLEIVERAFREGAHGYVYKPRALRDVLPVLDAIIRGAQFVSGGLERVDQGDGLASHHHAVLFYSSDEVLVGTFSRFIAGALEVGNVVIVLVTEAHDERLRHSLRASHVDVDRAIREQRYLLVNISELLTKVMVGGRPDSTQFANAADHLLTEAARRIANPHARVVACGECAPSLWAHGQIEAALQLEHLWDGLVKSRQLDTLCAYPLVAREECLQTVRSLCAEHTAVEIS